MDSQKLLKRLVTLIFFIFVANFLGNKFYWYSSIWYFDMFMHFLSGFWVGLAFIYLFPPKDESINSILKVLFSVLVIGAGWEVFEFAVNGVTTANPFNFLDTFSDIFFDLAGGASAIFYFFKRILPINNSEIQ